MRLRSQQRAWEIQTLFEGGFLKRGVLAIFLVMVGIYLRRMLAVRGEPEEIWGMVKNDVCGNDVSLVFGEKVRTEVCPRLSCNERVLLFCFSENQKEVYAQVCSCVV